MSDDKEPSDSDRPMNWPEAFMYAVFWIAIAAILIGPELVKAFQ